MPTRAIQNQQERSPGSYRPTERQAGGSHVEGLHPALPGVCGPAGQHMPHPTILEIRIKPVDWEGVGQRGRGPHPRNPPFKGKGQLWWQRGESAPLKGVCAFAASSWARHDLEQAFPRTQGQGRNTEQQHPVRGLLWERR